MAGMGSGARKMMRRPKGVCAQTRKATTIKIGTANRMAINMAVPAVGLLRKAKNTLAIAAIRLARTKTPPLGTNKSATANATAAAKHIRATIKGSMRLAT